MARRHAPGEEQIAEVERALFPPHRALRVGRRALVAQRVVGRALAREGGIAVQLLRVCGGGIGMCVRGVGGGVLDPVDAAALGEGAHGHERGF